MVVAVLILTSCSGQTPELVVERETQVTDLVAQGHSVEVSNCVTGLADGMLADQDQSELIAACESAEEMLNAPEEVPDEIAFVGPIAYGDDPELDALWDQCEAGDGSACDQLWELAPVDSDYERFGVTCGEREDVLDCTDITPDPATE